MFKTARIKLTAWYLLIIMSVSLMFSTAIFRILTSELDRFERIARNRIERRLLEQHMFPDFGGPRPFEPAFLSNPELIEETKQRIIFALLIVNGVVLVLSGAFGFLLAGRTLKPIQNMVEEQNRFIADASHELKTPLTSLKSAFEVYLRSKNQNHKEANEIITDSLVEVDRMQILAESLLTSLRYKTENNHIRFEVNGLDEIINEAVKKISSKAKEKEIIINSASTDLTVFVDKQSIINMLVIVLDNAIKYGKKGGRVDLSVKNLKNFSEISIKDNGCGISKENLPFIFDRFYRADESRSNSGSVGGFGLGLSIAKQIIKLHNGTIKASSIQNKGTIITIKIPIKVKPDD